NDQSRQTGGQARRDVRREGRRSTLRCAPFGDGAGSVQYGLSLYTGYQKDHSVDNLPSGQIHCPNRSSNGYDRRDQTIPFRADAGIGDDRASRDVSLTDTEPIGVDFCIPKRYIIIRTIVRTKYPPKGLVWQKFRLLMIGSTIFVSGKKTLV